MIGAPGGYGFFVCGQRYAVLHVSRIGSSTAGGHHLEKISACRLRDRLRGLAGAIQVAASNRPQRRNRFHALCGPAPSGPMRCSLVVTDARGRPERGMRSGSGGRLAAVPSTLPSIAARPRHLKPRRAPSSPLTATRVTSTRRLINRPACRAAVQT